MIVKRLFQGAAAVGPPRERAERIVSSRSGALCAGYGTLVDVEVNISRPAFNRRPVEGRVIWSNLIAVKRAGVRGGSNAVGLREGCGRVLCIILSGVQIQLLSEKANF